MPVRAGIVCLWAESKNSARSIDYTDDQLAIGVIAGKRVIVAGKSLHIALCRSPALHDGRQCRLTVESADGARLEARAQIALADWSSPHFPRVLRHLCEGALSSEVRTDGVGGLERFLGFRAAWRVETLGSAQVGQSLVTVAGLALNENAKVEAFVWDGLNLNAVKPQVIACGETSIFVWSKDAGGIGYFGHQKRLLEIETATTQPGARARIVAMLGALGADAFDRVVQGLAAALPVSDWTGLDALLRAALTAPGRDRPLPAEAGLLADPWRLQGVYRTGAHVFVLTRHTQGETGAPEPVALTWFGEGIGEASGERPVTVQSGIRPGTRDAFHLHQAPAPPALKPYGLCAVHRLASNETVWVPIRELSEPGVVAELQASLDFEKAGDAVLADLHAPMQHALAEMHLGTRPERRLCAGSETDGHGGAAAPVVIVLSDGDPGTVELTLVGLISTIGAAPYRLLLVLRAEDDAEQAACALERYARHSNCRAELVLAAARRPLSTTLKLLLAGDGAGDGLLRDVVLLAAGTVLIGRDWWARLTDELACHPDALFVGESAAGRQAEVTRSIEHASGSSRRSYRDPVPALAWREPELPHRLHGGLDTVQGLVAGLVRAMSGRAGVRHSSALRTMERPPTVSSGTAGRYRLDQAVMRLYERPAPPRPIVQLVQGKGGG